MAVGSAILVFSKAWARDLVERLQSRRLGLLRLVLASLLGIASPLCLYGAVPLVASFSPRGMRDGWLAAFMMGSILQRTPSC